VASPTFVLIHGFQHGAACWTPLVEALGRRGAPAVAVDLPCEDPTAGLRAYADVVLSKAAVLDDVVVVGHSMGGLTAPIVAGERPVRGLVLLCSAIPAVGISAADQMEAEPDAATAFVEEYMHELVVGSDGTYAPLRAEVAKTLYYHDCPPRYQDWAVTQLRRQAQLPIIEISPMRQWPEVELRAIVCTDDRTISPDWSRRAFRERFDLVPDELPGGHSPFLSRPAELAELLLRPYTA
jgi:pimeloyl-ACP methyl ester carboxylesterase